MEIQTAPVTEGIQPPPHLTGGPAEGMEEKPRTMVDDLVRFQSNKARPATPENVTESPKPSPENVEVTPKEEPTPQGKDGIFYDGRKYSPEEISKALKERDELLAKTSTKEATTPAVTEEPGEDLETLMYTDPKRYTQIIKQQAADEVDKRNAARTAQQKFKDDFYNNYKDLKGSEDLVEYYATKIYQDNQAKIKAGLAKDPDDVALSKLAQTVRTRIAALKGEKKATEELSSKPAITAGATGTQSGSAPTAPGPGSMSFLDQLRMVQRRGKTKY